jgi:hypothetical protein
MTDSLYDKYHVERIDGQEKPGAAYFVLDYVNDPYARQALVMYAAAINTHKPRLADDLRRKLRDTATKTTLTRCPHIEYQTLSRCRLQTGHEGKHSYV